MKAPGGRHEPWRHFGEFLETQMATRGLSETRIAQLSGCETYLISKLLHGHTASERVILRILIGLAYLDEDKIVGMSLGLASAGLDPIPLPGRDIPSHEDHEQRKRGSLRGVRFGIAKVESGEPRKD